MYTLERDLRQFSAAHRIVKNYQGKCRNLHGHNYAIQVSLNAAQLDVYDFVIDFSDIDRYFNQWVQDNLDHAIIASSIDHPLLEFAHTNQQKIYILPGDTNTSVEALASHLFTTFSQILASENDLLKRITLSAIQVWETPSSSAKISTAIAY